MRYLITGAAGFIGSNLAAKLSDLGHEVLGLDNFSPYYSPELKNLRIEILLEPRGIEVDNLDLSDLNKTSQIVRSFSPESIIHLAGQPGVRTPIEKSYRYIQDNLVGFSNIIQSAVVQEIPYFLYASSSSVYGNSNETSYRESDKSIEPISLYGATKLSNEILAHSYVKGSKTRARGMRFFTVYGPWGRPDMAYFRIINAIVNQTEFSKFGNGEVKRDFTYVDDITSSVVKLSNELEKRDPGYSDVVNIGGGNPHSLNDLIKMITKQTGGNLAISQSILNPYDTKYTCADLEFLKDLTNSSPSISLEEGVAKTISWAINPKIQNQLPVWIESTS